MVKKEGQILKCEHGSSLKIRNELLIHAATGMNRDQIQKINMSGPLA